ncbi:ankyrin repeat-containing protein ITN1-like [Lycium ferocissimum]|uniref:ankyrin repeat-containing protein ITN1-like n=1 Tax=Lycium ferocissimum TaxID=112874 RepID=UPI002815346C|nr:ankyrin repeat-containing protein ITN1-like [Lycium ferocissimum]
MPMDRQLYLAVQQGELKVLDEYKNQITTELTPYKNTVLHVAAEFADLSWIQAEQFLGVVGPDLLFSLNSNGDTCIHVAARQGHFNLVKPLIGYMKNHQGLDIEACQELLRITNNDGDTALHKAVRYGHHNIVKLLVKEDADFFHPPNNAGKTPLYLALEGGDEDSAKLILCNSKSLSYAGPCGTTALHAAAIYNATGCMDMILRNEPSLTKQVDDLGWSPLHFAAYFGFELLVRTLLMADKQMASETTKEDNKTPLHLAAINGKLKAMEEILEQCPDSLEAVTTQGQNVLHLVAENIVDYVKPIQVQSPHLPERYKYLMGKKVQSILERKLAKRKNDKGAPSWKERANTHLIVATLITTVSFAAGFTLPGGYNGDDGPDKGMAILSKKAALKAFAIADTIAMISSTAAVFLHYLATYDQGTISRFRYLGAGTLVMVAMVAMVVAFMAGLYTVLPNSEGIALVICVMCSLSLVVFIILLGKRIYDEYYGFRKIEKEEGS